MSVHKALPQPAPSEKQARKLRQPKKLSLPTAAQSWDLPTLAIITGAHVGGGAGGVAAPSALAIFPVHGSFQHSEIRVSLKYLPQPLQQLNPKKRGFPCRLRRKWHRP